MYGSIDEIAGNWIECYEKANNFPKLEKKEIGVFSENNQKFVLRFPENSTFLKNKHGFFETMEISEAEEILGDRYKFVPCSIQRITDYMPVPIMTPSGDYCILAIDAFKLVFHQLVFVFKIFQKIELDSWNVVVDYVKLLMDELEMDTKSIYFVALDKLEEIQQKTHEFFKNIKDKKVNAIKNIGKDGFNLKFLKKELKDLGLVKVLPNVTEHAKLALDKVESKKKQEKLRTCDLFDASRMCQFEAFLGEFPKLRTFLHNQNACYHSLTKCELCEKKRMNQSEWKEYKSSEVTLKQNSVKIGKTKVSSWYLECSNGTRLFPNYSFTKLYACRTPNYRMLIMDDEDLKILADTSKPTDDILRNLGSFLIVPDTYFEYEQERIFEKEFYCFKIVNSFGDSVMDASHSVFFLLRRCLPFLNAITGNCGVNTGKCRMVLKIKLLSEMKEFGRLKEGAYISFDKVNRIAGKLTDNCGCLTPIKDAEKFLDLEFLTDYLSTFFEEKDSKLKKMCENVLTFLSQDPRDKRENGPRVRVDLHDSDANHESLEGEDSMDFEEELQKANRVDEFKAQLIHLQEQYVAMELDNGKLMELRKLNEELSSRITELTDSDKKLTDANTQLTKRVTQLESQLKNEKQKTERMESRHRKEISEIKRSLSEQVSENSQLETQLAMKNSEIESLNQKYQDILKMNEELKKNQESPTSESENIKIIELESLLEEEKQKTHELAQGMIPPLQRLAGGRLNLHLEKEISEIRRTNCRLENENIRLSAQVEQLNLTLKAVFQHFGPIKTIVSSSPTQTTPEELTKHQLNFRKIKDSFSTGKHMKQAKDMIERLISASNGPELHEMARYELLQYEGQIQRYLQSVEVNIQNSEQLDLPDFPSLSDRFLKEYWKYCLGVDDASEDGPPECLICLGEMFSEEKTMKLCINMAQKKPFMPTMSERAPGSERISTAVLMIHD
ncbi:hypothetical protein CAEBREN_05361 [Caenorhabditis brenneri]|uniref:Uncharacterized protein n=1 Tax=Caenorhabditis brenneri TaxID=135651 RepID=G0MWM2_CAEBE|nr:hypothetical protein CAEBREN_05361 [Caenorhabditis brenneri]